MDPPTRKVVTRSPARAVRLLNLYHFQADPIECESSLERDFVLQAVLFSQARSIRHQPFKLLVAAGSYTPDFLVRFEDDSVAVVEVKPHDRIAEHVTKLNAAAHQLRDHGMLFFVADELALRRGVRAKAAKMIRRYGKTAFSTADCDRAIQVVRDAGEITLGELIRQSGFPMPMLLHLLALRRLACSGTLSIDASALVQASRVDQSGISHAIQFREWLGASAWSTNA